MNLEFKPKDGKPNPMDIFLDGKAIGEAVPTGVGINDDMREYTVRINMGNCMGSITGSGATIDAAIAAAFESSRKPHGDALLNLDAFAAKIGLEPEKKATGSYTIHHNSGHTYWYVKPQPDAMATAICTSEDDAERVRDALNGQPASTQLKEELESANAIIDEAQDELAKAGFPSLIDNGSTGGQPITLYEQIKAALASIPSRQPDSPEPAEAPRAAAAEQRERGGRIMWSQMSSNFAYAGADGVGFEIWKRGGLEPFATSHYQDHARDICYAMDARTKPAPAATEPVFYVEKVKGAVTGLFMRGVDDPLNYFSLLGEAVNRCKVLNAAITGYIPPCLTPLQAAVPELLEGLKQSIRLIKEWYGDVAAHRLIGFSVEDYLQHSPDMVPIRAALAKAGVDIEEVAK